MSREVLLLTKKEGEKKKKPFYCYCFKLDMLMLFVISFYQRKNRNLMFKCNALPL